MPILVKLDDILHARRMTLTQLSERVDITLANLSILKTGKARAIRFSTLEAICAALHCQPGDLLEFSPDPLPLDELTLDDDESPHIALKESHHE
jgi:putative transcriptional regulator